MPLTTSGLDDAVNGAVSNISHIGLTDPSGTELSGGDYERLAVTWATAVDGTRRPSTDLEFDVPAGSTVGGWKGFTASTGGTTKAAEEIEDAEEYTGAGTYILEASKTAIIITSPA